ncbi:MAG: MCE family protein [Kiritimatiellae bacterium]|nr:MCE family protein [Kiritimatiellia bacterium]
MSRPFKLRYASEIAGFFVLVCVALLVAGIFLAGQAQGWFEPKLTLHAVFTTDAQVYATADNTQFPLLNALVGKVTEIRPEQRSEGAFGLQAGAEVKILNTVAGTVTEITPNERGDIEATFVIRGVYQRYVRKDSVALVKKKFEIAGDAFVEILPGDPAQPMMPSGAYIQCRKDTEIIEIAMAVLADLRDASLPTINQLRMSLEELPGLTIQLQETLHEIEKVSEALQRHWLLRRYAEEPYEELISPSDVGRVKGAAP